jgi:hypothetical protein
MRVSTFHNVHNSVRRIPGDLRVSSARARLAYRTAMQSRAGAFVQALISHYNGWQTHWPTVDLVLRQKPSGITMSPIYHQVQMQVAPRLSLTIRGETHVRHQRSIGHVERTLREQLVHYLGTRGTRIDVVATQGSLTASGVKNAPSPRTSAEVMLARPVSRVVRRPIAEPAITNHRLTAETATTLPGRRPGVASRANPPAPPPIDMNRLTDQVIQAIDRRIIAQRERLGRA